MRSWLALIKYIRQHLNASALMVDLIGITQVLGTSDVLSVANPTVDKGRTHWRKYKMGEIELTHFI